ncbi:transcriptional regulator, ArsR family [Catenulispora acidiphila DSM 44928]|uniref:Transcriptional regulator, ArsR family n=1 Tax=Catenulispora acidiphila (strain DSM 44928 / JCM 14897 / NBRC 102108 / NRRL B-24433 / ID139908) TaxID=479433 RepID=C7QGF6_CATAD|nr:helix-turn-helix domain-containing protein [Catenulispora acidiphila]ACU73001.1 transcriptional regulator, ArsR family [Catenulispora acidiphila DSM 44928]
MTLLRLSPRALSRSRFALSPMAETLGAMRLLANPCLDPWMAAWHERHAPAFRARVGADRFTAGLARLLTTSGWLPDFVTLPPPGGMRTTMAKELEVARRFSDAEIRAQLELSEQHAEVPHGLDWLAGTDFAARCAQLMSVVWRDHVLPDWPRRRALLEREVTYRAGLVAVHGWSKALGSMNRRSEWVDDDAIRFSNRPLADRVVGAEGMLFVPVSLSRGTWLCEAPPAAFALVYPARGVAVESAGPAPDRAGALERLIGAVRARILLELSRPATTTELATLLEISLGTTGGHIAILRDAGLIEGTRVGRRVVYRRTDDGDRLAGAP